MLESHRISCPYCGEIFDTSIDASVEEQCYIEDCEVCCHPILFRIIIRSEASIRIDTLREDDA